MFLFFYTKFHKCFAVCGFCPITVVFVCQHDMSFTRSITNVCGGLSCHAPLTTLTTVTFCRPENAVTELKLIKSRRSDRGSLAGHHSSFAVFLLHWCFPCPCLAIIAFALPCQSTECTSCFQFSSNAIHNFGKLKENHSPQFFSKTVVKINIFIKVKKIYCDHQTYEW